MEKEKEEEEEKRMDSGKVVDMVMGVVTVIVVGSLGHVFTTLTEHDKRIEKEETVTGYHDEQLKNLWQKRDLDITLREEMMKNNYEFQIEYWKREVSKGEQTR